MKLSLTGLLVAVLIFSSCGNKQATQTNNAITNYGDSTMLLSASGFASQTDLPKSIDLKQSIEGQSLQDLRLLRSYAYAIHGLYFMEADLLGFFEANTKWYRELIYELEGDDKLILKYEEIKLSADEQSFVDKIDKRIIELKKNNFEQSGDYKLGNVKNIVNLFQYKEIEPQFAEKLNKNNFVITTSKNIQLFHTYEENDYQQIPNFITTDLYLQAFHMYFGYTLKSLEQQKFIPILTELSLSLYNESMALTKSTDAEIKNLAEFNAVYYAIPYYLLTEKKLPMPERFKKDFEDEIAKINKQEDEFSPYMSFTDVYFPYSLFKPRGHYTRKPIMESYFKAMMWLQTAVFCKDDEEKLKQTVFSSYLLNNGKAKDGKALMTKYNAIYEPVVFLIGESDNLSFMDIAQYLDKQKVSDLSTALSSQSLAGVNTMLAEVAKTRNKIKPKIEISCTDKINFMPQRYLIDNDVIQNLVDVKENAKRAYPRGLDVFAAFGSKSAADVLTNFYKEKDNWKEYTGEMKKLQTQFKDYKGWNYSIYNKWIESLLELQKPDKNYPEFMQTKAWDYKNLNTSLASWAELKHDAILYAEQPMSAECGGGGPPPPIVKGYVEPNIKFWNKLSEMVNLTGALLKRNGLMTDDLQGKTDQLSDYVKFLIQVTQKELKKQILTDEEYQTIEYMGSSIEYFSLSVINPEMEYLDNWSLVQGPDKSIAVVADIYTRNVPGCPKNGILHVATGNVNNIYVVVEIGGYLYLTKGATFSYYEFVQPLGTRLTDEEWQKMLEDGKAPAREPWMKPIIIDNEPKSDERIFYSSGC